MTFECWCLGFFKWVLNVCRLIKVLRLVHCISRITSCQITFGWIYGHTSSSNQWCPMVPMICCLCKKNNIFFLKTKVISTNQTEMLKNGRKEEIGKARYYMTLLIGWWQLPIISIESWTENCVLFFSFWFDFVNVMFFFIICFDFLIVVLIFNVFGLSGFLV